MFENILLQATGDTLTLVLGLIVALVSAVGVVLKQYNSGAFTKQRLTEQGLELRDAIASEATARRAAERMSCIGAQLILANNDGKITEAEYNQIVATARTGFIETTRELGLDSEEIVKTAELLLQKKV